MSGPEQACFARYLSRAQDYLEFGCGGSTVYAAELDVPRLASVDSSSEWVLATSQVPDVARRIEAGDYRMNTVDIGPVGDWGWPTDPARALNWPAYSTQVWHQLTSRPDFILVDGRFRLSCALQSVARVTEDTLICVHDFERPEYAPILKYTTVVEQVERLVLLRRQPTIDLATFTNDCAMALLDPR